MREEKGDSGEVHDAVVAVGNGNGDDDAEPMPMDEDNAAVTRSEEYDAAEEDEAVALGIVGGTTLYERGVASVPLDDSSVQGWARVSH